MIELGKDVLPHNQKKTHCPAGHEFTDSNTIHEPIRRAGRLYFARRCRICRVEQARERMRKVRGIEPENYRVRDSA